MTLQEMKDAIKLKLESIDGIEKVYTYNRHTTDWAKFFELFKDSNNRINAWIIQWQGIPESNIEATGSIFVRRKFPFKITGLYSLKDDSASANSLDDLAMDVVNEFDGTRELGAKPLPRWDVPATTSTPTEKMFGNYLVNTIEVNLSYEDDYANS